MFFFMEIGSLEIPDHAPCARSDIGHFKRNSPISIRLRSVRTDII